MTVKQQPATRTGIWVTNDKLSLAQIRVSDRHNHARHVGY
ncbi:hypothetical protein HMPREF9404_3914 [Eggerthella sp. HGA1]|nr:hypothetical protein HMPREF9404_3914 [Eggerthella sp. HGA1]